MLQPEKGASRGELLNLYAYASNDPVGKVDAAGEEPGDNAARASMALVQGPKAAADQKKEDAKAARENGWWVGGGAAAVVAGGVALPAVVAALRASPVVARVVAVFTGAQSDARVRQAEQQVTQQGMKVAERVADATKSLCFAAGTPVHAEQGLKAIEEVAHGDLVWAQDEATGEVALRSVVRTFVTPEQPVVEVVFTDEQGRGEAVRATPEHPFWTQRGWIGAHRLSASDRVLRRSGAWSRVTSVYETGERVTVYNFEVESFHTYFVGEQGVLVHNNSWASVFQNQLSGRLASELAAATRVGAGPIRMGTQAAEKAMNSGTIKWVVTEGGELLISPHTVKGVEISHAVLSGGRAVLAAGQAEIAGAGGRFVGMMVNNHSGHFMPSAESVQIGIKAFAQYGIGF